MKDIDAVKQAIKLLTEIENKWQWKDKSKMTDEQWTMRLTILSRDKKALQSLRDLKAKLDEVEDTSDT